MDANAIGVLAYAAGVRTQSGLQAAIAIALAESGGNPAARGDVGLQNATWGPSIGLWQIRSLKAEKGKGTVRDETKLYDPAFNAKSMYAISRNGVDWGPWTTWPLRAAIHMPAAIQAATLIRAGGVVGKPIIEGVDAVTETADSIHSTVEDIGAATRATYNWVGNRDNWIRVGKVVVGGGLVLGGAFLMAKPVVTGIIGSEAGKIVKHVVKAK